MGIDNRWNEINVQYKSDQNCHCKPTPLYSEYILIKKFITKKEKKWTQVKTYRIRLKCLILTKYVA
jgi:hypothetical protein